MNKDQIKGSAREAGGKLEKNAGKAIGSTGHQVKGAARELAGKAQKEYGDAKHDMPERRSH